MQGFVAGPTRRLMMRYGIENLRVRRVIGQALREDIADMERSGKLITDARGRSVAQLDPVVMYMVRQFDVIPKEPLGEIARDVGLGMTKASRLLLMVSLVCVVIALVVFVVYVNHAVSSGLGFRPILRKLLGFFVVLVCPITIWAGARQIRFQRISRVMLEHLRCPHCGYDLRLLPVNHVDGATVCPECGCAWRLERSEICSARAQPPERGDRPEAGRCGQSGYDDIVDARAEPTKELESE